MAERAGIAAEDRLLSWTRGPGHPAGAGGGELTSPFDAVAVETEEAPRGPVVLRATRGGKALSFTLRTGEWGLRLRPPLPDEQRLAYLEGLGALAGGRTDAGLSAWSRLAAALEGTAPREACWLWLRLGEAALKARRRDAAASAYAAARAVAQRLRDARLEAVVLDAAGLAYQEQRALDLAIEACSASLQLLQRAAPSSLSSAAGLDHCGRAAYLRVDLESALERWRAALAIRERLAPRSLELASTLNALGSALFRQGDLARAEEHYGRALRLRESLAPDSLRHASLLANHGLLSQQRGDLARAEGLYRRALGIAERLAPTSRETAFILSYLGTLSSNRDDLAAAEAFHRRALAGFEAVSATGPEVAGALHNLANVATYRRDFEAAEPLYRRALALREKLNPESLDVASSLSDLGSLALERGRLDEAEPLLTRSLALKRKLAPGSLAEANSQEALAKLALARKDHPAALRFEEAALRTRSRLAPRSWREALSRWAKGRVHRELGQRAEATASILEATRVLDLQRGALGVEGLGRESFEAKFGVIYRDAVELLAEQGRNAEAFEVLERSRARALLATLAERDLVLAGELAPDLARERGEIDAEHSRVERQIGRLSLERDARQVDELNAKLEALRDRREALVASVRRSSPRLASLKYPEPLSLPGTQEVLDPGTLLLAFSVGESSSLLFVVKSSRNSAAAAQPGLAVFPLPVGRSALAERVGAFRGFIARGRETKDVEEPLLALGARLYDDLLRPAEREIEAAERLLILPDGPLHAVPFAALVASRQPLVYLAERKPLHTVLSATVYAQLRRPERSTSVARIELAALGDPVMAAPAASAAADAPRAYDLKPLPWTRDEVRRIGSLFGSSATVHFGKAASEERARSIGRGVRYVHFATHGILDRRFPLDSGLVFSPPLRAAGANENGILQAWEIFESVRLDADLVVLSACETGLGREMGGEGLISLARAFQYAGARSVLASLWEVADRSTPDLMFRFYERLKQGRAKDEALQAAELALLRAPSTKHPFYWAAFELNGDWK
jgi:CHAT domain-containing protein/Tfp pilus assembly protein PilF